MKTVFSNGRKTLDTVLVGESVTMRGQATIGDSGNEFHGQISRNDTGAYVGDYSQNNLSLADTGDIAYIVEAATMLAQLSADVEERSSEGEA